MSSGLWKQIGNFAKTDLDFFPLRHTLSAYRVSTLKSDFLAAINVALLAFPQGMAYALIAGLPIQYGIFGACIAALSGSIFARSHLISLGPTNATSVLLLSAFAAIQITDEQAKIQLLPIIVLLSGLFLMLGALFKAAQFIQFISRTVITGYITAAALLIITNQLKNVLGIDFGDSSPGSTFIVLLWRTITHLDTVHWHAVLVSLITISIYLPLNRFLSFLPNVALTLVLASAIIFGLQSVFQLDVKLLGGFSIAQWNFSVPQFDLQMIRLLLGTSLAIALLSVLEGISIGKSLAARSGEKLQANQEMFNMGMANFACGFGSGMPASGSLTRSMLNWKSGAKSPLSLFFTGLMILLCGYLFGPFIVYVPTASLAVVVIAIGVSLINKHQLFIVTHSTGSDLIVFWVTFMGGLVFPLDIAIYLGAGTSILLFLKKAAAPELVEYDFTDEGNLAEIKTKQRRIPEVSIVHVEGDLFFGSAELFRDQIRRISDDECLHIVVLRMKNAHILDATSVLAIEELVRYMNEKDRILLVSGVRPKIHRVIKKSGLVDLIGEENIFEEHPENPTYSTAMAMKRAQEILGGKEATVTIYAKEKVEQE